MTEREKATKYLACDGCGYIINPKEDHFVLTTKRKGRASHDLHFHYPQQKEEGRSWGSSDCLGYWYMNKAARELSMAKHQGDEAVSHARHLGAMAERYPSKAKP